MHVVHLVAADTPAESLDLLEAVSADSSPDMAHSLLRLGSNCQRPPKAPVIHAPLPIAWLRGLALRHTLNSVGRSWAGRSYASSSPPPTIIMHAWSLSAAASCLPLVATHRPIVINVASGTSPRLLATWSASATGALVCDTEVTRQALLRAGVPAPRCVLIRPAFASKPTPPDRRPLVRRQLKLDPQDIAVAVLTPITRATGAHVATWAALLLEKVVSGLRLLIPRAGVEADRIRRLVRACRHEAVVRFIPETCSLWELLAAADLAVYLPPGDAPVAGLAAAMLAECPIVASSVRVVRELLTDAHSAWLCPARDPKEATRCMLRALECVGQSRRHAQEAHARAVALFALEKTLDQYRQVYANLALRRPAAANTAGHATPIPPPRAAKSLPMSVPCAPP